MVGNIVKEFLLNCIKFSARDGEESKKDLLSHCCDVSAAVQPFSNIVDWIVIWWQDMWTDK